MKTNVSLSVGRRSLLAAVLSAMLAWLAAPETPAAEAAWQAGAARVNITPDQLMWMSGYGNRDHPAEGKLTDLWAKALVLDDGNGNRGVVLTLDLVGIDRQLSQRICQSLKKKHGLERRQIAICCSHTHTGPVVGRNLEPLHYLQINERQQALVDEYASQLHDKILSLVESALRDLELCTLAQTTTSTTFAVNRRENRPESEVEARRAAGTLQGPFDHDVPVLAVRTADDEQLKAVVFGYACHATVLSFYQWSGDYPGFAQMEIEKRRPDCVALFWAGCGADQNPLPRRSVELARKYGTMLADAVDQALDGKLAPVSAKLAASYQEIDLPLDTLPTREEIEQNTRSKNKFEAARARMLLERIDSGQPLSPTYPYPVAAWQLGDEVTWLLLGGEVVVDYALRLKAELGRRRTWVAGYTNDVMAYIPSRRVLREGGYEGGGSMVYYGLPTIWAPELEEQIVSEAVRQAR